MALPEKEESKAAEEKKPAPVAAVVPVVIPVQTQKKGDDLSDAKQEVQDKTPVDDDGIQDKKPAVEKSSSTPNEKKNQPSSAGETVHVPVVVPVLIDNKKDDVINKNENDKTAVDNKKDVDGNQENKPAVEESSRTSEKSISLRMQLRKPSSLLWFQFD